MGVADAEQRRDARRGGSLEDRLARAGLQHVAVVEHDDLIGQQRRLLGIVRDEHGAEPLFALQPSQLATQAVAHRRVESAERLVEQQHARSERKRSRERDASLLATR